MEYKEPMKVGSLFSGIGGLDLGLERAGMDVIWQSEIDPYACKILDKHWPTVPNLGNIKEIDWSQVERPDVICGGYPCQPFSTAGKRQGEGDARHLWPWVRECIAELRPRYAVLENVRGHLSLGFGTVLGDLASIGYDTEWQVIPAAAVGAPHRRDRVFIVAYANQQGSQRRGRIQESETQLGRLDVLGTDSRWPQELADTDSNGWIHGQTEFNTTEGWIDAQRDFATGSADVADTTQQSSNGKPDYIRDSKQPKTIPKPRDSSWQSHGSGQWWAIEPDVGRVAHGIPNRVDRLRCLGNAVVPQVAEYVGRLIMAAQ